MKFNRKSVGTKTVNLAGGDAFKETPEVELVSLLLTSFVEDKFYESKDDRLTRLRSLVKAIKDKKFLGQAAIFARTKFGMRSISHVLLGEIAKEVKGESWVKNAVYQSTVRPDDLAETLAYYANEYGKPIPNSLKKGVRLGLSKFDAYQLGKYRMEGSAFKLVDLINLTHPKDKNANLYGQLLTGKLKSQRTWEKEMTQAGQKAKTEDEKLELKKEGWAKLVKERKIGYFALLRNLRNIIGQAPEVLDEALDMLTDKKLIKGSLVLPFRYVTALEEIEKLGSKEARKTIQALNKALDIACENVPKFDGETLVALDISSSMTGRTRTIAGLFAAILVKANNADLIQFNDVARYRSVNPSDSVLTIAQQISDSAGGTNYQAVFMTANRKYDQIITLSDEQGWVGDWNGSPVPMFADYKKRTGANPKLFSFDLAGYGTLMFPEKDVYLMAGFSEKVFDLMVKLQEDRNALVEAIRNIPL